MYLSWEKFAFLAMLVPLYLGYYYGSRNREIHLKLVWAFVALFAALFVRVVAKDLASGFTPNPDWTLINKVTLVVHIIFVIFTIIFLVYQVVNGLKRKRDGYGVKTERAREWHRDNGRLLLILATMSALTTFGF